MIGCQDNAAHADCFFARNRKWKVGDQDTVSSQLQTRKPATMNLTGLNKLS